MPCFYYSLLMNVLASLSYVLASLSYVLASLSYVLASLSYSMHLTTQKNMFEVLTYRQLTIRYFKIITIPQKNVIL